MCCLTGVAFKNVLFSYVFFIESIIENIFNILISLIQKQFFYYKYCVIDISYNFLKY